MLKSMLSAMRSKFGAVALTVYNRSFGLHQTVRQLAAPHGQYRVGDTLIT